MCRFDYWVIISLVGRRRGNDPYIKHLAKLGLKISTVYFERVNKNGSSSICITVPISRNAEFLDTAAVYAWVREQHFDQSEIFGACELNQRLNSFFSIACTPVLKMIAARGQWIKTYSIWLISAMELFPTKCVIGSVMARMRSQFLHLPIALSDLVRCVRPLAHYSLTVKSVITVQFELFAGEIWF